MQNFKKLQTKITEEQIDCEIIDVHAKSYSVDDHVKALGIKYREGLSTLLYKTAEGQFVVLLRRDDCSVDLVKFAQILKTSKISFASPEDLANLGLEVGLLSPLALPSDFQLFVDQKVTEMDKIICGAMISNKAIRIERSELFKHLPHFKLIEVTFANPKRQDSERPINRVLSGITPSGEKLHIGNYFGAVKDHIQMQDKLAQTFYFIADLHALTTVKNSAQLQKNITNVVLDYLALGLDPNKAVFFRQSDVPEHEQLAVILANYVSYGQMQRMHAFKDKLAKGADQGAINMGLFNYPILMAADILAYCPDGVPVGEDQRQHIELTRDIAENFNQTYNQQIFPLPVPMIKEQKIAKVVGTDGERKMSKSLGNVIEIFGEPETIKKQIMGAYTDPNRIKATDPGKVEGNPIFVYHDLLNDDQNEVADLKIRYQKGQVGDVEVKQKLIAAHSRMFGAAQERRNRLAADHDYLLDVLATGATKAKKLAGETLAKVYQAIGLSI